MPKGVRWRAAEGFAKAALEWRDGVRKVRARYNATELEPDASGDGVQKLRRITRLEERTTSRDLARKKEAALLALKTYVLVSLVDEDCEPLLVGFGYRKHQAWLDVHEDPVHEYRTYSDGVVRPFNTKPATRFDPLKTRLKFRLTQDVKHDTKSYHVAIRSRGGMVDPIYTGTPHPRLEMDTLKTPLHAAAHDDQLRSIFHVVSGDLFSVGGIALAAGSVGIPQSLRGTTCNIRDSREWLCWMLRFRPLFLYALFSRHSDIAYALPFEIRQHIYDFVRAGLEP